MPKLDDVVNERFRQEIEKAMVLWSVRGCTIVFTQGEDHRILTFGKRNKHSDVTGKALFSIASCSKLVTCLTLLRILGKHNLTIDTRIKSIYPEFRLLDEVAQEACTFRDLLTHQTGLPGYDHLWNPSYNLSDLPDRLGKLEPTLGFRGGYQYNSLCYDLIVRIIEYLTKEDHRAVVQREIFDKMGMRDVTFDYGQEGKEYASGFWTRSEKSPWKGVLEEGEREFKEHGMAEVELPFGLKHLGEKGGLGTGRARWLKSYPLLPVYQECLKPLIEADSAGGLDSPDDGLIMYGLGQRISKHRGCEVIEHSGEIPGFLSRISRLPAHNVGLGILTNSDPGGKYLRAYVKCRLIEEFTGLEKVNWLDIIESKRQEQLVRASKWLDWFGTHIPSEREHAPTREINNVDIDPLTGTWEKDGFDKWTITSENLVRELPILETLPFIPSLYGSVRYFFSPSPDPTPTPHLKSSSDSTPAGEGGWYDACIAWTPGSASTSTCTTAEDKESLLGGCESKSASLGSELYGAPFKVRLADENRLEVYGLMGVGEGLTEDDHSITFHRVV